MAQCIKRKAAAVVLSAVAHASSSAASGNPTADRGATEGCADTQGAQGCCNGLFDTGQREDQTPSGLA